VGDLYGELSAEEGRELRRIFFAQAHEIAEELQDVLLRIEADPGAGEELKVLKRLLHTLKGDANSMGFTVLGHFCHRLEDVLVDFAGLGAARRREGLGVLYAGADEIRRLLAAAEGGAEGGAPEELIGTIDRFVNGAAEAAPAEAAPALTEYQELQIQDARERGQRLYEVTVQFHPECGEKGVAALMVADRVTLRGQVVRAVPALGSAAMDEAAGMTLLVGSPQDEEELERELHIAGITLEATVRPAFPGEGAPAAAPAAAASSAAPAPAPAVGGEVPARAQPAPVAKSEILRVESAKVDRILDLVGELIIGRSMLDQAARHIEAGTAGAEVSARLLAVNAYLERTVSDLHKGVMKMRMVPVQSLFRKFPRMIRDLANLREKRVRLEMHGEETELDKGIVDALGEPLTHLIRNMVDHGIEAPEARRRAGKAEEGTVTLRAFHEASQIVIEAADDGGGIDTERLKQKAVALGQIGAAEAEKLTDAEACRLVFLSGLSTAESVSETSGRGVGMDAVKNAVEAMKGTVEIESAPGRGATFRLRLPITLAVIKALLFEAGSRLFAIPVAAIAEVARVLAQELKSVDGRPAMLWRDQVLVVVDLRELFRIAGAGGGKKFVLVLSLGGRRVGLLIDRLLWQQELVVKAMDERYLSSNLVAGASILGDGKVVLILDAVALVAKAIAVEKEKQAVP
jgi:two-component system chemotaxis sensor kinase CheA